MEILGNLARVAGQTGKAHRQDTAKIRGLRHKKPTGMHWKNMIRPKIQRIFAAKRWRGYMKD